MILVIGDNLKRKLSFIFTNLVSSTQTPPVKPEYIGGVHPHFYRSVMNSKTIFLSVYLFVLFNDITLPKDDW